MVIPSLRGSYRNWNLYTEKIDSFGGKKAFKEKKGEMILKEISQSVSVKLRILGPMMDSRSY